MITLTLFGRGGQGIKSAAHIISSAAFLSGYYVQDQPLYGAERRGAPISAFIRISNEPILARGYISYPLFVIVADDSLLQDKNSDPLKEMTKDTILFVNSTLNAGKISSKYEIHNKLITFDLTQLAIDILGKPMISVAVAGATSKLINLNFEDVKQSLALELKDIGIRDAELAKNIELARAAFESAPSMKIEVGKEYDVSISDTSKRGEGIARIDGFVIFVPGTRQGQSVRIKVTQVSERFASGQVVQSPAAPTSESTEKTVE